MEALFIDCLAQIVGLESPEERCHCAAENGQTTKNALFLDCVFFLTFFNFLFVEGKKDDA